MGKIAFVFSGQGAQHIGMAKDFYETCNPVADLFEIAEVERPGTLAQMFEGDGAALRQTENTQPCLYLADLAAAIALRENDIVPDAVAGFSLGEIPALAFAGAYSELDGFRIAAKRGACMADASDAEIASMAAIVRIPSEQAEELAAKYDKVYPVNYNSPMQLVVSGDKEQLAQLSADVKAVRGRAVPLAVSGAFHSPYMTPAVAPFAEALADFDVKLPEIPVYSNYTSNPYEGDPKALMCSQINNPVRWTQLIRNMAAEGFDIFIECGAGNTLQKLVSQILPEADCYCVENAQGLAETLAALGK